MTKSKEEALIEAEEILRSALERVLIVEQVQNQNLELRRKIEIFQAWNWPHAFTYLLPFYAVHSMNFSYYNSGRKQTFRENKPAKSCRDRET